MEGEAGIKNDRDKFEKAPTVEVSPDLSDKFTVFERWLRENGTKTRKLELRDYGNEVRGCHATSEIVEDETIIEVPLKCLITVEMGKDTDVSHPSITVVADRILVLTWSSIFRSGVLSSTPI